MNLSQFSDRLHALGVPLKATKINYGSGRVEYEISIDGYTMVSEDYDEIESALYLALAAAKLATSVRDNAYQSYLEEITSRLKIVVAKPPLSITLTRNLLHHFPELSFEQAENEVACFYRRKQ